ncbi:MAG: O-antigen ligase [Bacilli bacterium]|nr:O-antigen ligase [Bacilli bacterium]
MYIVLILLVILFIFDYLKNRDIFSPAAIFNSIWFVILGLYELKLSLLQQDLSERTIMVFLVVVLSYNIGCFIFQRIDFDKIKLPRIKTRFDLNKKLIIARWIVVIIFLIEVIYSNGFPLLWTFTGSPLTYLDFGVSSLNGAFYGLVICLGAYTLFNKRKDGLIYLVIGIMVISRQVIMSMIIEGIIYAIYTKKIKISFKKIVVATIIGALAFGFVGNLRSGSNVIDSIFYPKQQYEELPSSAKWVYSYMTFSVNNLNNLINLTDGGVNHGASMLKEFLPTVLLEKLNISLNFQKNYLILSNFNVSTYLPSIYLDFGIIGIVFFNIIISMFGTILHRETRKQESDTIALAYSVFVHNIIFMFFINMFLYLPIMIQFFYLIFLTKKKESS